MKVLVVSNLYPPFYIGGYELACRNIVEGLLERGNQVLVLTSPSHYRSDHQAEQNQVPIEKLTAQICRRLQMRSFQPVIHSNDIAQGVLNFEATVSNYANTCEVLNTIAEFSPDVVYLFNLVGIGGLAIIDILNYKRVPWVMHLMDCIPHLLKAGIYRPTLAIFNAYGAELYKKGRFISMSKHLIREIKALSGINLANEARIIPGWAQEKSYIADRQYKKANIVRFVSAGAVRAHKGIDIILEAAFQLKSQETLNFIVEIYGDGDLANYVDMAKRLTISDVVRFYGPRTQNELSQVFETSDAFLFPTWEREPFGFAPIEAAAVGCIPIVTSTCGAAERLINNVNCLKIDRTATSLASTMRRLCNGEVDCKRIGANAQAITREDLSFEICMNQIHEFLTQVLAAASSGRQVSKWKDYNLAYLKHNLALELFAWKQNHDPV